MAKPFHLREKYLDGKELFYRFYEQMGKASSLNKLQKILYNEGTYNPETGRPFGTSALFQAMWRWALMPENFEEASAVYKKYLLEYGEVVDDATWKTMINERIYRYLNKGNQKKFFKAYPDYDTAK